MTTAKTVKSAFLFLSVLINLILLWHFHDRFWWPQDDGVFAHLAERVAHGEVLHKDVQEMRSGYAIFIDAAALQLFGKDFVSLRYPLVLVTLLQGGLIFYLFGRLGVWPAFFLSITVPVLGLLQFLNANHQWYCAFLAFLIIPVLRSPARRQGILLGLLIGTIFHFRQLTGVFVAIGVFSYLLWKENTQAPVKKTAVAKILALIMFIGLSCYLFRSTDMTGYLIFGLWPQGVLMGLVLKARVNSAKTVSILIQLLIGAALASLPLWFYHLSHDSLAAWFNETLIRSLSIMGQPFLFTSSFRDLLHGALLILRGPENIADIINGLYWFVLLMLPIFNGVLTLNYMMRQEERSGDIALPWLACFYTLVALHNPTPIYLYFCILWSLAAVVYWVWFLRLSVAWQRSALWMILFLYVVGLTFHAGRSLRRSYLDTIRGKGGAALVSAHGKLPHTSLWIDPSDLVVYTGLIELIESYVKKEETIFAVPNNSEVYFLSGRRNPFWFFGTDQGVQTEREFQKVIQILEENPPALISYVPTDKRNTVLSFRIMDYVRTHYKWQAQIAEFEIYLRPDVASRNGQGAADAAH